MSEVHEITSDEGLSRAERRAKAHRRMMRRRRTTIFAIVAVLVLGVGGFRVASGALTIAALVTFIMFLFMLVMPLGQAFVDAAVARHLKRRKARLLEEGDGLAHCLVLVPARGVADQRRARRAVARHGLAVARHAVTVHARRCRRPVTVVGGGVAGLTAAIALQQRGAEVTVLERAPAIAEVGAVMIVVFTAAGHVLRVPEVRQLVGATRRLVLRLRRRGAGATS